MKKTKLNLWNNGVEIMALGVITDWGEPFKIKNGWSIYIEIDHKATWHGTIFVTCNPLTIHNNYLKSIDDDGLYKKLIKKLPERGICT